MIIYMYELNYWIAYKLHGKRKSLNFKCWCSQNCEQLTNHNAIITEVLRLIISLRLTKVKSQILCRLREYWDLLCWASYVVFYLFFSMYWLMFLTTAIWLATTGYHEVIHSSLYKIKNDIEFFWHGNWIQILNHNTILCHFWVSRKKLYIKYTFKVSVVLSTIVWSNDVEPRVVKQT